MEGIPLVGEQAEQGLAQPMPRHEASLLSPLRYPGGKRRLVGYIAQALQMNGLRPKLYVEPFAGGASVAIQLLNDGHVERIALGERDPPPCRSPRTARLRRDPCGARRSNLGS